MGDFSRRDFIKAGAGVAAASALGVAVLFELAFHAHPSPLFFDAMHH